MYDRAKMNGTAFQSREQATSNFKQKYGSQYTNKFSSEPKSRPNYIPQTTNVGGRNYTVIYNQGMGGYGYCGLGGRWMMYDMMMDMAMVDMMMGNHGYYYGAPPSGSHMFILWWILGIIVFVVILAVIFGNRS